MTRYKLTIAYDCTGLVGWQRQKEDISVQGCIEEAIFRYSGERPNVQCAGRTDAGVHAFGQVAHVDIERPDDIYTIGKAINFHLRHITPKSAAISIIKVEQVADDFHARFDAKERFYEYRILSRPSPPTIERHYMWHLYQPLDIDAMQKGANHLLGQHDFTSFRAAECQSNNPVKTLNNIDVSRESCYITIRCSALSFLHHQVRNIVGTLSLVGIGKWQPEDVKTALEAKDRKQAGPTAPAHGLYFVKVEY